MARKAREKSKTGIYNIIAKSTDILFKSKEDYEFFVDILKEYIREVYAYALTPAYICLVVKESEKGIGLDMKPLITKYARYYNRTYANEGKIFDDRFKSEPINDDAELKNSIAILSNIVALCGDGVSSSKPVKKYEMIPFYAKLTGADIPMTKRTVKYEAKPKKTTVPKKEMKKETPKDNIEKPLKANSEQQRKNLPTWLL